MSRTLHRTLTICVSLKTTDNLYRFRFDRFCIFHASTIFCDYCTVFMSEGVNRFLSRYMKCIRDVIMVVATGHH